MEVTEPIRLHVAAKRYLCTVEPGYIDQLSEPSVISLRLQGGVMTPGEVLAFESLSFANEAVQLRRWDDLAKDPEMKTVGVEGFEMELASGLINV
jgi:gamma-butyrobetaine dioxygenase